MGEMASSWLYEENPEMEQLGQKLLCTTMELEKLKAEAIEEMSKNKEYINQLIRLLRLAIHERDEARNQLQKLLFLLNKNDIPLFQPNSSSITESNSLSSPVESLFDADSSQEFSNINLDQQDQESLIIDSLAKGRVLPQRGKLLQAVIQAGPLLQPFMAAGPLPRWRNPPQMQQPFHIPPLPIKASESAPQVQSMLNFGSGICGTNSDVNGFSSFTKRQRFT